MGKKKIVLGIGCVVVIIAAVILGRMKMSQNRERDRSGILMAIDNSYIWEMSQIQERDRSGILLAFDDFGSYTWEDNFDLFDQYGVKVTFFVSIEYPVEFCFHALERGHEIGFHTKNHVDLTQATEEEVYQQAIEPIEMFMKDGIELTSFAYPYGKHNEELDERLLQYYDILRGAYHCEIYDKDDLRHGFVESFPIDNGSYESQEQFEEKITEILQQVKETKGAVVSLYSHDIGGGDWSIGVDKLVFIFQKAEELGLRFYTFRELQEK